MKNLSTLILITALAAVLSNVSAQSAPMSQVRENPFAFEASYLGDFVSNIKGGIKTGSVYLGLVDLGLGFDTEKAGLWNGGEIFIHAQNTHGGLASGNLIGDIQVPSNIENGNFTYLYELWYKQSFGKFSILAGVNDLNAEFAASEYGGLFLNSAFGIHSSIALNVPVSIFPKTSLGMTFTYEHSAAITLRMAVYDGDPGSLDDDPHNFNWSISKEEGLFSIGELQYDLKRKENKNTIQKEGILIGTYKVGAYFHSGTFENSPVGISRKGNYGLYLIADQVIIPRSSYSNRSLSAFTQMGWSPADRNANNFYLGTGINVHGLLFGRYHDILGVGIAHAKITTEIPGFNSEMIPGMVSIITAETALEISYKVQIIDQIAIQPGLHYIINPGAVEGLDNAIVPTIRLEVGI